MLGIQRVTPALYFLSQTSVIQGTYFALDHMSKEHSKEGGVIINVSSMAGKNVSCRLDSSGLCCNSSVPVQPVVLIPSLNYVLSCLYTMSQLFAQLGGIQTIHEHLIQSSSCVLTYQVQSDTAVSRCSLKGKSSGLSFRSFCCHTTFRVGEGCSIAEDRETTSGSPETASLHCGQTVTVLKD